jgi:hypothetical protein
MPGSGLPNDTPEIAGWMAGRMIDGVELRVDGEAPRWSPPRWIRALEDQGYDPAQEGDPFFVVAHAVEGDLRSFSTVRAALRSARSLTERRRSPVEAASLRIECRTPSGRVVPVVSGPPILGMARGALDAEPITAISGPAYLPPE